MLTPEERAALAAYTPTPETIARVNAALLRHHVPPDPKGPPYLLVQPRTCSEVHALEAQLGGQPLPRVGDLIKPRDPLASPMGGAWDGSCMHGHPTNRVTVQTPGPEFGWIEESPGPACKRCPPGVISFYKPEPKPGR